MVRAWRTWDPRGVRTAAVLVLAAIFGAVDQYLGSLLGHYGRFAWATDVSLLSAPWLLLAFLAGATQRTSRRAAAVGSAATFAALFGYLVMTLSPVENAHLSSAGVLGFLRSERLVFAGALLTGPLFGWFGQRWRVGRSLWPALLTAAALCGEPLVRAAVGRGISSSPVALAEVGLGLALAASLARSVRNPAN